MTATGKWKEEGRQRGKGGHGDGMIDRGAIERGNLMVINRRVTDSIKLCN